MSIVNSLKAQIECEMYFVFQTFNRNLLRSSNLNTLLNSVDILC